MSDNIPQNGKKLPPAIWALGLVSLLMDVSSEIIHSLLPVFLVSALGASVSTIGALEGVSEAVTLLVKTISGPLSDWFGKRKPLVVLGYSMATLSKPMFALSRGVAGVYTARIFDRIGKGIRGAPRDALIADIAPAEIRGRAFGLRQSLDTVGAVLGPVLAITLMKATSDDYRAIFWVATIPAALAVATLFFGVEEPPRSERRSTSAAALPRAFAGFLPSFWLVVGAGAIFQLARFSEAFLILRAKYYGLSLADSPLALIVMNLVYAISSYPLGGLSDRIKREWLLLAGLVVLCAADLCLAVATNLTSAMIGIGLWGLHLGLTQGTLGALVTDHSPSEKRGTAFGIFNLASAISLLLASAFAGTLWDRRGPEATFYAGAIFSAASFILFLIPRRAGTRRL